MNWLTLAVFASVCYAAIVHIDKYLLSKFFRGKTIGALLLFSSFGGIPVWITIAFFAQNLLTTPALTALLLTINGALFMVSLFPYFEALKRDETSMVTPLFQLVSVFSAALGYIFLDEVLTTKEWLGCALVLSGGFFLSLDLSVSKIRIKLDVLFLMIATAAILAVNGFLFKYAAENVPFVTALFWEYTGVSLFAIFAFYAIPIYRKEFIRILTRNKVSLVSINILNETLGILAKITLHAATLLSPLALVYVIHEGAQPVFTLFFGIVLTLWFPNIAKENISLRALLHKGIAIGVMIFGTLLLG